MRVVHKVSLDPLSPVSRFAVGADPKPLMVGVQRNDICVWIEQDDGPKDIELTVEIVGTGHAVPAGVYFGSVLTPPHGEYVFHAYYRTD